MNNLLKNIHLINVLSEDELQLTQIHKGGTINHKTCKNFM